MTTGKSTPLSSFRGREYYLLRRADPTPEDPDTFCVAVYYKDPETEEHIEVARVDNSHGETHLDQLYRRGSPKKDVNWDYGEAISKLSENWRRYARNHEQKNSKS